MSLKYTVGTLSKLTGLSQHTIRAWERRYQALSPDRTEGNHRLYGADDVERLSLLRDMVEAGHSIGQVAHLPTGQLRSQTIEEHPRPTGATESRRHLEQCQSALDRLDMVAFEEGLVRSTASLGVLGFLQEVVVPLLGEIETRWLNGSMAIAQEHLASAALRTHLDRLRMSMPGTAHGPRLLATTPRNQAHEIGAMMVATLAAMQSWNVTYLGPNLPAEEIANAARQCRAHAIGLSLVFPLDDPVLPEELSQLRSLVGPSMHILVGGRGAVHYAHSLDAIGALVIQDLAGVSEMLNRIARD